MDNILDIFKTDAFSSTTLSLALSESSPTATHLGNMGLFRTISINTLTAAIERIGDTLQLVAPSERGGPGSTRDEDKRTLEDIRVPHFQRDWSVNADEVQDVRAYGQSALQTVNQKVAEKLAVNSRDLDITEEYARLGAVQGIITYKGGSTLNLFTKFGVSQPNEVSFDLIDEEPVDGALRQKCTSIIRATRAAMGGNPFEYVHALVGDTFFDDLLAHPEVRETYRGWSEAQILRDSYVGKNRSSNPIFEFGGIVFENYGAIDSTGDGALLGIPAEKAKFFPVGNPDLFVTFYAPADYVDAVNKPGLRRYAKQWQRENGKGIDGETQTNALSICTRPNVLMRATR